MKKKPVGPTAENRKPVKGHYDAAGKFTPDEVQQIVTFIEVGAKALQANKPLAESQNIGATGLALIQKLQSPPVAEPQT